MTEPEEQPIKQHWPRLLPPLALAVVLTWYSPGPRWMWVCQTRPCGAVTLIGPLLATIASAIVFGVIYRYV